MIIKGFNKANREEIKAFIESAESSLYEGKNEDEEDVIVIVQQGVGMDVKTAKKNRPKWFEVIEYDKNGFRVGVTYEWLGEKEKIISEG